MTEIDIWDEKPRFGDHKYCSESQYDGDFNYTQFMIDRNLWLERLREEFREIKAQSRVHRQHRMLYQGQRDDARKKLEAVTNIINVDRKEWNDSPEFYRLQLEEILEAKD